MLPDFPKIKKRLNERFEDIIRAKVQEDPLLGQIHRNIVHEGNSLTITSSDGYSSKTDYQEFASNFGIPFDEIIKKGPEAFYEKASNLSKDMASQMVKHTIATMEKVTERTGNVVRGKKGEGITPELILDAIDKMEISFDERNMPIMPVILISPTDYEKLETDGKQYSSEFNARIEKRRKEIIEKKRKEWLDRESSRKLVD